jgi:Secretion system C-terminal sorting domain
MKKVLLFLLFFIALGTIARAQVTAERPGGPTDERTVVVFPNPSSGILHITVTGFDGASTTLRVLNVIGNEVHRENVSDAEPRFSRTVDLSNLATGLYYVKIENGTHAEMRKVVIR